MTRAVVDRDDRPLRRRHHAQRPVEVALAQRASSSSRNARGFGRVSVIAWPPRSTSLGTQSRMTLPASPERAAANAASWSRNPNRWVIAGRDVQPRLEHHRHLVPGLVHLTAVDPPDRQQLEHDLVDVERDLLARDAEDRDAAAVGHVVDGGPEGRPGCPTSRGPRRSPRPCPAPRWTSARSRSRGSTAMVAPIRAASSRRTGFGSLTTTNRAPGVAGDGRRHQADRPGARDQHVLAEDGERERGVHGVAERVEDRGDVLVDARPVVPDVGHRQRRRTRRTRRRGPTPRPTMWAHRWRRPARQWRHSPQVTWPSPLTMSPGPKS